MIGPDCTNNGSPCGESGIKTENLRGDSAGTKTVGSHTFKDAGSLSIEKLMPTSITLAPVQFG